MTSLHLSKVMPFVLISRLVLGSLGPVKDVFLLLRARAEDDDERGNWSFHSHQFRAISGVTEALRGPIVRRVLNARRRCVSHTQVSKVIGSIWVD